MIPVEHPETRPEKYLREIRDLQEQNQQLLKKLVEAEENNAAHWKWGVFGKIAIILLPYFFSIFVAWAFYTKVQNTFENLKETIVSLPSSFSSSVTENVKNFSENAKNTVETVAEKLKKRNVNTKNEEEEPIREAEDSSESSSFSEKWEEVKSKW